MRPKVSRPRRRGSSRDFRLDMGEENCQWLIVNSEWSSGGALTFHVFTLHVIAIGDGPNDASSRQTKRRRVINGRLLQCVGFNAFYAIVAEDQRKGNGGVGGGKMF